MSLGWGHVVLDELEEKGRPAAGQWRASLNKRRADGQRHTRQQKNSPTARQTRPWGIFRAPPAKAGPGVGIEYGRGMRRRGHRAGQSCSA
jgi:hypothetical protein